MLRNFHFAGAFCAKALQDEALLDLPLSLPFARRLRGDAPSLSEVAELDPDIGRSVQWLADIASKHRHLRGRVAALQAQVDTAADEASVLDAKEQLAAAQKRVEELRTTVEASCLDFSLMGHPDIPLRRVYEVCALGERPVEPASVTVGVVPTTPTDGVEDGSADGDTAVEEVTLDNLEEYLRLTIRAVLVDSVAAQLDAFRAGFNAIADTSALRLFSVDEIALLFSNQRSNYAPWTHAELEDAIVCSHGYSIGDRQVRAAACMPAPVVLCANIVHASCYLMRHRFNSCCRLCAASGLRTSACSCGSSPAPRGCRSAASLACVPASRSCARFHLPATSPTSSSRRAWCAKCT